MRQAVRVLCLPIRLRVVVVGVAVVRGVGAAARVFGAEGRGACQKLPLFEEPKLEHAQPARDSADFNDADDTEPSRPRRRRVTRYDDDDEMRDERPRRRRRFLRGRAGRG